jgi:hypothetical protein
MSENLRALLGEKLTGKIYEHHYDLRQAGEETLARAVEMHANAQPEKFVFTVMMKANNATITTVQNPDGTYTHTIVFGKE